MKNEDVRAAERVVIGDTTTIAEKRAFFIAEISKYIVVEKVREALSLDDLRGLGAREKLCGLQNAMLGGIIRWAREQETDADLSLGLYVLIVAHVDMADACCWVSVGRLAKALKRHERTIYRYLERLVDAGLIAKAPMRNGVQGYYPII